MRSKQSFKFWLCVMGGLLWMVMIGLPSSAQAKVTGQCALCHTMHNSQNGQPMTKDHELHRALTRADCIGCHTADANHDNNGTNIIPYVMSVNEPTYDLTGTESDTDTLAGGSFYWVATNGGNNPTCGHNVKGLAGEDPNLGLTPPGWCATLEASTYSQLAGEVTNGHGWTHQLTCAGTWGCHGKHVGPNGEDLDDFAAIRGAHHGDDGTINGTTVANSFRFLFGITGTECNIPGHKWEYHPDASDHNEYQGANDYNLSTKDPHTISYLCAECHGEFHADTGGGSPWLRHPTDYEMQNKGEYAYYGGGSPTNDSHTYQVIAPVASEDATSILSTVSFASNQGIVTCISCHRAHGTPYPDLLRWDYDKYCIAGGSYTSDQCGCFKCHTQKQ